MSWRKLFSDSWRDKFGVSPLNESIPVFQSLNPDPALTEILRQEQEVIDRSLSCLFGYHLLEVSVFDVPDLSAGSTINHRFRISPCQTDNRDIGCWADIDALPFPNDSLDVVIAHHLLDYAPDPHHALKALAQAVVPSGYLIIVGFNPLSRLGVSKVIGQAYGGNGLCRRHALRIGRLQDWLRLLDFECVDVTKGYYLPPVSHRGLHKHLQRLDKFAAGHQLPGGGFYCIVAKKNVCRAIPIKPKWDALSPVLGIIPTKTTLPTRRDAGTRRVGGHLKRVN